MVIVTPPSRVVGPLPNGLFMAHKWGLLTKWHDPPIRPFWGETENVTSATTYQGFLGSCVSADPLLLWGHGMQVDCLGVRRKR